jgi:hypothetical protein
MADIKKNLKEKIARLKAFSTALDDSTDASDTAQLAIFIREADADFNITEELLALQPLKGTTTVKILWEPRMETSHMLRTSVTR